MVTPSYMQVIVEELRAPGPGPARDARSRWASSAPSPGPRRCAATSRLRAGLDAVDIYGLSRGDGPGRGQRMRRDQGRPGDLGRPFLPRDHRPRHRRGAARRRGGRAGLHHADQGGAAGDPLPHARPDAAAAAHRAQHAPHGQDRRPQRRHADHPRRQRVPDADRGAGAASTASCRASTSWWSRARATLDEVQVRCELAAGRTRPPTAPPIGRRAAAPHQDADRRQHHGRASARPIRSNARWSARPAA